MFAQGGRKAAGIPRSIAKEGGPIGTSDTLLSRLGHLLYGKKRVRRVVTWRGPVQKGTQRRGCLRPIEVWEKKVKVAEAASFRESGVP